MIIIHAINAKEDTLLVLDGVTSAETVHFFNQYKVRINENKKLRILKIHPWRPKTANCWPPAPARTFSARWTIASSNTSTWAPMS
jgi:hypothetical protein